MEKKIVILMLMISALFVSGCGSTTPGSASDTCGTSSSNAATKITYAFCERISACTTTTCSSCTTNLVLTKQIADDFAVPVEENSTAWQEVVDGVDAGTYVADTTVLSACIDDLAAITCDELENGYDESSPTDYENVENLVDDQICNVFE